MLLSIYPKQPPEKNQTLYLSGKFSSAVLTRFCNRASEHGCPILREAKGGKAIPLTPPRQGPAALYPCYPERPKGAEGFAAAFHTASQPQTPGVPGP